MLPKQIQERIEAQAELKVQFVTVGEVAGVTLDGQKRLDSDDVIAELLSDGWEIVHIADLHDAERVFSLKRDNPAYQAPDYVNTIGGQSYKSHPADSFSLNETLQDEAQDDEAPKKYINIHPDTWIDLRPGEYLYITEEYLEDYVGVNYFHVGEAVVCQTFNVIGVMVKSVDNGTGVRIPWQYVYKMHWSNHIPEHKA